jgi:DNA-binding NtrC family response regulator
MNGIEFLKAIRQSEKGKNTYVIMFTGFGEMETAVEALRYGAYDYLFKPIEIKKLNEIINRITDLIENNIDNAENKNDSEIIKNKYSKLINGSFLELPDKDRIGIFSQAMERVVSIALKFHEERRLPILIEGESGTGKEIIASIIHHGIKKNQNPFISINCSAISGNLFESELFGYEGGTFTGAKEQGMMGKLELAENGSLFLDEIGDMPLEMQPKLLRVLQEKSFYKVGGLKTIKMNARIIAATNKKLNRLVEEGKFRQDLYYRLNPGTIYIPPLREQKEAILPLAQMFLNQFSEARNKKFKLISEKASKILLAHEWNGNIRELRNVIDRIILLYNEIEILPEHLNFLDLKDISVYEDNSFVLRQGSFILPEDGLDLRELDNEIAKMALEKFNGNRSKAAKFLGLSHSSLRSRLK